MEQDGLHSYFKPLSSGVESPVEREGSEHPKYVDFFCGIGGSSQGARQAGFEVVLAVDNCEEMLEIHERNHPAARHVCAELPREVNALGLPDEEETWHLHGAPPYFKDQMDGLQLVRWFVEFAAASDASSWTMENVAAPAVMKLMESYKARGSPLRNRLDYERVRLSDHGVPQDRVRLIAGSPRLIQRMRRLRPLRRSVRDVIPMPRGTHVRGEVKHSGPTKRCRENPELGRIGNTYTDDELCRPIDQPGYTITARHTLRWARPYTGTKLKYMSPRETALMQTFPVTYELDRNNQRAIRGLGSALPPIFMERLLGDSVRVSTSRCDSPSLLTVGPD